MNLRQIVSSQTLRHVRLVSIDENSLAELRLRVPDFPEQSLQVAVSRYLTRRDHPAPPSTATRDELDLLAQSAIELYSRLYKSSPELRAYLIDSEQTHDFEGVTAQLSGNLASFMDIAEMARRDAEKDAQRGRGISPRTELVRDIAAVLEALEFPVTPKSQDRLVLTFCIALRAAGETAISDPAKTVKSALATIEAKQLTG